MLVYDEAEVRKIVIAARWVMDRLGLVEGVTSPRGLVVSFKVLSLQSCVLTVCYKLSVVFIFNCFVCLKLRKNFQLKRPDTTNIKEMYDQPSRNSL